MTFADDVPTPEWIAGLPKVELHVHLEGAIRPETLMRLAAKNGVDLPPKSLDEFRNWYAFRDFPHFAEVYQALSRSIVSPEDIYEVAWQFLAGQARQNIRHTEATYTAFTHYRNRKIAFADQVAAIRQAADKAHAELGVTLGLIVDIPREWVTDGEAMMVGRWVADAHGDGLVVALGLAGYEVGFPPQNFRRVFDMATEAGVPAVIHAGETGPAENVRHSVELLNAVRIGHGVAALADPYTVALLREQGTTLEVCPSSNVCLKVVEDLPRHPLKQLDDLGLDVTINTDDPPIFNTDLDREYLLVAQTFGYSRAAMKGFARRAAKASFAPDPVKNAIVAEIDAY